MTPTLEELVSQMIDRTSHITIVDGAGGVFEGRRVKLNDLRELHLAIHSALDQALAMQREEVIEECAKVCDDGVKWEPNFPPNTQRVATETAFLLGKAIRALKG